ncbi:hypothetical protein L5B97_09760 [Avibacterium sp. 20-15]|uniref:hypothetical protein n=1 Tax=unclassified Avibacterium TaxID=2685287 RepID=UPI0020272B0C|nr:MULTISPECIES: hypothetical protein [unclassified Avibacterium]MCW9733740.1 hypothetical protein [Avibacterium sp. 20-15]URL03589.1 hypothetical protein L4F93_08450 [Avibacterium sp. 20-132]
MKKLVLIGLISTVLAGCAAHQEMIKNIETPVFKSEIDKFTGDKKAYWSKSYYDSVSLDKFFAVSVLKGQKVNANLISLIRTGKDWKYLKCHTTNWLVNGKPIQPLKNTISTDVKRNPVQVVESIDVVFTNKDMKKFGTASSVEYRVCNDEFKFTSEELKGLKRVIEYTY